MSESVPSRPRGCAHGGAEASVQIRDRLYTRAMAESPEVRMKGRLFTEADVDMMLVFGQLCPDFKVAREWRESTAAQIDKRAETVPHTDHAFTFDAQAADKWWHGIRNLVTVAYERGYRIAQGIARESGASDATMRALAGMEPPDGMGPERVRTILSDGFEGGFPSDRLVEMYYAQADRDAERAEDAAAT